LFSQIVDFPAISVKIVSKPLSGLETEKNYFMSILEGTTSFYDVLVKPLL
jgi:hypothetical protein